MTVVDCTHFIIMCASQFGRTEICQILSKCLFYFHLMTAGQICQKELLNTVVKINNIYCQKFGSFFSSFYQSWHKGCETGGSNNFFSQDGGGGVKHRLDLHLCDLANKPAYYFMCDSYHPLSDSLYLLDVDSQFSIILKLLIVHSFFLKLTCIYLSIV